MTRVLVVDDDCDHAESLADVIEMRGHEARVANSGEEALDMFRNDDFDFVLLDVKLPGINGVETFLEMRKIRPTAQVMLMTGYSVEQLVAQAIEGGALGVLHKAVRRDAGARAVDQDQAARPHSGSRRRRRLYRQSRAGAGISRLRRRCRGDRLRSAR